jgi:hypothetical protein
VEPGVLRRRATEHDAGAAVFEYLLDGAAARSPTVTELTAQGALGAEVCNVRLVRAVVAGRSALRVV